MTMPEVSRLQLNIACNDDFVTIINAESVTKQECVMTNTCSQISQAIND